MNNQELEKKLQLRVDKIKEEIQVGDHITASLLLKTSSENVRTRFRRHKIDVIEALEKVIANRKEFINQ